MLVSSKGDNMETTKVTIEEFKQHLDSSKVDWNFYLSDDSKVYWKGEKQQQELETIGKLIGPEAFEYLVAKRKDKWNLNK